MHIDGTIDFYTWAQTLTGSKNPRLTWQVIPEAKGSPARARILHGTFEELEGELDAAQGEGCGVFACVNETDGKGRTKENITKVRAVWCDVDGQEYGPCPEPTMVVATRNGWHLYWMVDGDVTGDWCEAINRSIAAKVGGDPASVDRARVLRVPGYFHQKDGKHMITVAKAGGPRYMASELEAAFPILREPPRRAVEAREAKDDTLYGLAAAEGEYNVLAGTLQGGRNRALNAAAFKLGALVAGGELTEETARAYLFRAVEQNGYLEEEGAEHVDRVIDAGMRAGSRGPRGPLRQDVAMLRPDVAPDVAGSRICDRWPGIESELRRRLERGYEPVGSPLASLNSMLGGGAPPGGVTLLCAPPGAGKSSLALQWCDMAARRGRVVVYISLELSMVDLVTRIAGMKEHLSWIESRGGKGLEKIGGVVHGHYEGLPFHIFDRHSCPSVNTVAPIIAAVAGEKPPLVVVDYIQLFASTAKDDEIRQVMGEASVTIRNVAQETGAAVLCISAVSRASYNTVDKKTMRPDRVVTLASAKETGVLEYDAEAVLGVHLYKEHPTLGQLGWVCVAKNRSGGPCGEVPVRFDGMRGCFTEADDSEVYEAHKHSFSGHGGRNEGGANGT